MIIKFKLFIKITELCPFDKNIFMKLIKKDYSVETEPWLEA